MTFRALVGHRRIKALLSRAISRGTLPPTLLFDGPRGVGKFQVALATAATLNCPNPAKSAQSPTEGPLEALFESAQSPTEGPREAPTAGLREAPLDACGQCRACDRIARGVHVDVVRLEPDDTGAIKIDAVRDVLEGTGFRPFEGRRRVVMIREADALLTASQNALLKSLEEPPPSTVFILTTAVPHALLPTVRSRCMRLRFARLTEQEVAEALERDHGLSPGAAREAATLADGSIGQALALDSADVGEMRDLAMQLLQQAARDASLEQRVRAAANIIGAPRSERTRDEIALIFRIAASMLRDLEVMKTGADPRVLSNPTLSEKLGALTRFYEGDRARDAFAAVDRAMLALERNAGTKVVAEWLASQI